MSTRQFYMIVFALALSNFGCINTQIGTEPINKHELATIRAGHTTKADINKWFGYPLRTAQGPEGEIRVYRYVAKEPNSTPQELTVSFNGNLVSSYSYH